MTDYFGDIIIPDQLATATDYATFVGTASAPSNIDLVLQAATTLVIDATEGAFYATDPATGLATDATIAAAMKKATLIQAAAWVTLGIDPLTGGVFTLGKGSITSKKIGSAQVTYSDGSSGLASAAIAAATSGLVPNAVRVLQQVNLLGTNPWYYG